MLADDRVYNVLFLCTGIRPAPSWARLFSNHVGQVASAPIRQARPQGAVHPMTLETLAKVGIPVMAFAPKPGTNSRCPAPQDGFSSSRLRQRRGETCPIWPGQPMTAHWESKTRRGGRARIQQRAAFEDALRYLRNRIGAFINLPLASIDRMALNSKLEGIGAMDGTTTKFVERR